MRSVISQTNIYLFDTVSITYFTTREPGPLLSILQIATITPCTTVYQLRSSAFHIDIFAMTVYTFRQGISTTATTANKQAGETVGTHNISAGPDTKSHKHDLGWDMVSLASIRTKEQHNYKALQLMTESASVCQQYF